MTTHLVWFRRDLRLAGNPAWAAGTHAATVCPLFVVDPVIFKRVTERRRGALVACLEALDASLEARGGRLRVEVGDPVDVVPSVAASLGAERVHLNGEVTPYGRRRDTRVGDRVPVVTHQGHHVHEPGALLTSGGTAFRVFTAFHRAWAERPVGAPDEEGPAAVTTDPGTGIPAAPPPPLPMGEEAARQRLRRFIEEGAGDYGRDRDRPDLDATSRLSVDLKYGTLGPATAYRAAVAAGGSGAGAFVRQLAWRDFFAQVMADAPETIDIPMRHDLATMAWSDDPDDIAAWKAGRTGYPLVDAGMRQLAAEGWVHNRVRMVVASFLVKDLLVDWRVGERFFRRHLLDADVAQNVGNWQWVAGTGTDAAPYFRVLNPVTQSRRFDPAGAYIKRWVPELARLDTPAIHAPWLTDPAELAGAGVELGRSYPAPLVDHAEARHRALDAYALARLRSGGAR